MRLVLPLLCFFFIGSGKNSESYSYFRDISENLSFQDIKDKKFITTQNNNLGSDNGVYWFKIDKPLLDRSILELKTAHVKNIELYDNEHHLVPSMSNTRFPSFFLTNRRLSFPLYLKAQFPLEAYFPLKISSESTFASSDRFTLLGIGFFYGIGLAIMIATLVYYFIAHNTRFLVFTLLIATIVLSVSSKDNILYFFGLHFDLLTSLESLGHAAIGVTATSFMLFYLRVKPHQLWIKKSMIVLSIISICSMIFYISTKKDYLYITTDIASLLTLSLMWTLIIMIVKGRRKIFLTIVYIINLFFLIDYSLLHYYGLEFLKVNEVGLASMSIANFALIAILLLFSIKRMQIKGVQMKLRIENYLRQLKELDTYKNIQDTDDDYLESLIEQFKLKNIEVKVLDDISKGVSNETIAGKYNLTLEKLQDITNSLYLKLGL